MKPTVDTPQPNKYNWNKPVIVSLIGVLILICVVCYLLFFSSAIVTHPVRKVYGETQNQIIFDKNNLPMSEADNIAAAFTSLSFFNNHSKKTVYVRKIDSVYEIAIACNKSVINNQAIYTGFAQLKNSMQLDFPRNRLVFNIVVGNINNVVKQIE
jgi:hypothetical protein